MYLNYWRNCVPGLEQNSNSGKEQTFSEIIIQAIVSHIYIEWIHHLVMEMEELAD